MKLGSNVLSLGLGIAIAWLTLAFLPIPVPMRHVSNFSLSMAPLEDKKDDALVAVGLLSKKSVMDSPDKKEIKPTKAPPPVPEHDAPHPVEKGPPPPPPSTTGPAASTPASTDMTPVPPQPAAKPAPPPQPSPPDASGPKPAPPVSSTTSNFMAEIGSDE